MKKNYKNVFWFLIDGLRPDFLHTGSGSEEQNFIDKCLMKGTLFDHVVTAGSCTFTSMHSIYTSFLPSYNGMTSWNKITSRKLNQDIFTIADYFQLAGYETFRYDDAELSRDCPMSGFKRWEGSGYQVGSILNHTDLTKSARRDRFIEDVNAFSANKFVYHHCLLLHDMNGETMGTCWTGEGYANNIEIAAKEFERLLYEYDISEDDLIIISGDHGELLGRDYTHELIENAGFQYEESVMSFFALIGKNIPQQVLSAPISSLDEMPTILHIALEESMIGQGNDQFGYITKGEYQKAVFFRELHESAFFRNYTTVLPSISYYLRDGRWKYVYSDRFPQCEWLIDLEKDGDYQVNLKDQYPELREKYRRMIISKFGAAKDFQYQSSLGFGKADIEKEFSLILQMERLDADTIESILDMSGPYYEVILPRTEMTERFKGHCKVRFTDTQMKAESCACGKWLIYLTENGEYSEYFLSDLYRYMQHHRRENVKIIGEHYVAVRRKEAEAFCGVDLYEAKQVRAIRYPHSEHTKDKYILFGCGNIGKEAIDYFGAYNVFCFVDNNSAMTGKEVCGKSVISFDELLEIRNSHTIVITTGVSFAREIGAQLDAAGINNYYVLKERLKEKTETCWESELITVRPNQISG